MKSITIKITIFLLGKGLLVSGCTSTTAPAPIYSKVNPAYSNAYEPMPFIRQDNGAAQPLDYQRKRDELKTRTKSNSDDTLIIGKPYKIKGRTFTPKHQPNYHAVGMASWSGKTYQGKSTAMGEPFNRHSLTGAHPTLPLNAMVEVTNLSNGKSLILRINDRGPFSSNRIINVTERAAQELGFVQSGLAKVRVEYVGGGSNPANRP